MDTSDASGESQSIEGIRHALGTAFEIKRILGRGSMATVYLARDRALERPVAIKVLHPENAQDETARRRFEREARAAASLSHTNIVRVYQYGRLPDETPYLVMEFVKGRTVEERVKAQGSLPVEATMGVLEDVASALAAAHARGIVHRDLRPANILWSEERDEALLTDFGIAAIIATTGEEVTKLTAAGMLLGDPRYISPEQLRDRPVTELSDVYSFGILGYELLAGRGPYDVTTDSEWLEAHKTASPRDLRELRSEMDPSLATLLGRCLSKEPAHRPSASDIVRALTGQRRLLPPPVFPGQAILSRLLRGHVPQAVIGATIVSWGLVEGASTLIQNAVLSATAFPLALVFAVAAVSATGVVAWYHGERGVQKPPTVEYAILSGIAAAWLIASVLVVL